MMSHNCSRCHHPDSAEDICNVCQIAATKDPFPYKGAYNPNLDEYAPDCKKCSGEGWYQCRNPISGDLVICPCTCNPEKLDPRP
jgi:hypothetical protein